MRRPARHAVDRVAGRDRRQERLGDVRDERLAGQVDEGLGRVERLQQRARVVVEDVVHLARGESRLDDVVAFVPPGMGLDLDRHVRVERGVGVDQAGDARGGHRVVVRVERKALPARPPRWRSPLQAHWVRHSFRPTPPHLATIRQTRRSSRRPSSSDGRDGRASHASQCGHVLSSLARARRLTTAGAGRSVRSRAGHDGRRRQREVVSN